MASNDQILETLLSKTAAISMGDLAKELGGTAAEISTQLKRLCEDKPGKPAMVSKNDEGNYEISDAGREKINPITEVSEGSTPAEVFKAYGIRIGIKRDLVNLTQEHIWNGGEWKDLNWVKKGFAEMNIPSDLAGRWLNVWRTYLLRGLAVDDPNAAAERGVTTETPPRIVDSKQSEGNGTARLRDYIIDARDNLLYVGEGLGNYEYADALKITTLRAAARSQIPISGVDGGGGGSTIDETSKLFDLMQKIAGGNAPKKTTLIVPDGRGGVTIQEVEAGSNVMIPKNPGTDDGNNGDNKGAKGYYLDPETNEMKEIDPRKPIVIIRKEVVNAGGEHVAPPPKVFVVEDGVLKEQKAGEPIIINRNPPPTQSPPGFMMSIPTANGNVPIGMDDLKKWTEHMFNVEDHYKKVQRDEEKHEMFMGLGKTLKDFGTNAVRAAGNMGNAKGEETSEEE